MSTDSHTNDVAVYVPASVGVHDTNGRIFCPASKAPESPVRATTAPSES